MISPAPREYRFVHYPAALITLPAAAVVPFPQPFVLPLYDARVLRVQQIEIPKMQTKINMTQPVDLIYSSVRKPEVIRKISKGENNLDHLNQQLAHTSKKNRSKKQSLKQQIDSTTNSLQFLGQSHKFPNGNKYIGEVESGLVHGYGEMRFKNRDRYEGYWTTGEADGYGFISC